MTLLELKKFVDRALSVLPKDADVYIDINSDALEHDMINTGYKFIIPKDVITSKKCLIIYNY